jgi:hypothetical protein
MKKIYLQRKVEVWIEDIYRVEEINDEIIESAISYNLDPDDSDVLWETQVDLGPVEVFDQHNEKIYSNIKEDE